MRQAIIVREGRRWIVLDVYRCAKVAVTATKGQAYRAARAQGYVPLRQTERQS